MIFCRPRLALARAVVAITWVFVSASDFAQEPAATEPATPPPAFNPPSPPAASVPPGTPQPTAPGASSATGPVTRPSAPPPSLSVSGGYGFVPETLTPGEGKLAKPKLRISVFISQGIDDNINSAPNEARPRQFELVLPGGGVVSTNSSSVLVPTNVGVFLIRDNGATLVTGVGSSGSGNPQTGQGVLIQNNGNTLLTGVGIIVPTNVTARTTALPTLRALPLPDGRTVSLVTNARLSADLQFATPRTVFTFTLNLGGAYYAARDPEPFDKNASLELLFVRKLTPRAQVTVQVSSAYSPQPDVTRINSPTQAGGGSFLTTNGRMELSYQPTARLQTSFTYNLESLAYERATSQGGNFVRTVLGEELKYQATPRTKLTAGYRYGFTSFNDPTGDSTSTILLGGFDLNVTKRLAATFRGGEEIRSYASGAQSTVAPYAESALSYRYGGGTSVLSWTSRYGLEESASSASQSKSSFRSSVSVSQVLSSRLQSSFSISYTHSSTAALIFANASNGPGTGTSASTGTSSTGATTANPAVIEDDLGVSLNVSYIFSPRLSLFSNYNFTNVLSSSAFSSYYRNQLFFGASYTY